MMLEAWRCDCGMSHLRPWTTCFRCQPAEHRLEADVFRAQSVEAQLLDVDRYCGGILARTEDGLIVRVREVDIALKCGFAAGREELVGANQRLKDENREVLAENARLRRSPERSERAKEPRRG